MVPGATGRRRRCVWRTSTGSSARDTRRRSREGWRTASSTPCTCARTKPYARQGTPRDREGFQARGRVWHREETRNERARTPTPRRESRVSSPRRGARRRRVDDPRAPTPRSAGRRDATGRRSPGSIVSRRMPPPRRMPLRASRRASRERGGGAERRGGSRDCPTAAQVALADAAARARHGREADVLFAPAEESGGGGVGG